MQSDVTLVGGATPAAPLPPVQTAQKIGAQAATNQAAANAQIQSQTRPTSTTQSAAITEAKVALASDSAPTAISQGERILKPYGVTMLPEAPVDTEVADAETQPDIVE